MIIKPLAECGNMDTSIIYDVLQNAFCDIDFAFVVQCGSVAETVAYDLVLEAAMKVQHFQQRNLVLHGPWKWLLTEFATYYGVSDVYTKLR